ncbi:MAG: hypothetical protein M5U26_15720 [Planctomycetota bacterium]|nr:hypothetical protein [Planctomycetota bacterium]
MLAANMLAAALTILLTMHWMKASPLSNRLEVLPGAKPAVLPRTPPPPKLLGKVGVASSPLRPAGTALIDDLRVEVVTEGDWIDRGASVEVIRVNGSVVTVREAVEKRET